MLFVVFVVAELAWPKLGEQLSCQLRSIRDVNNDRRQLFGYHLFLLWANRSMERRDQVAQAGQPSLGRRWTVKRVLLAAFTLRISPAVFISYAGYEQ